MQLTHTYPKEGIVVAHSNFLTKEFLSEEDRKLSAARNIVEIKPDRELRRALRQRSNFVIVQNTSDPLLTWPMSFFITAHFVNYWPQPSLIPRDPEREDVFKNIFYFGRIKELHPDLCGEDFSAKLRIMGLDWKVVPPKEFNDYSQTDAVIALRPQPPQMDELKPASKLINAWTAGVPAILGPESAYRCLRRSPLDYLEANNADEAIKHLEKLRKDPALRQAMAENGRKRSIEFTSEKITDQWEHILLDHIVPYYKMWTRSPWKRLLFFLKRKLFWLIYAAELTRW